MEMNMQHLQKSHPLSLEKEPIYLSPPHLGGREKALF